MKKETQISPMLILIFFSALILRAIGLSHGFPFLLHPDEPTIIRSALGIRFNLNPEHFDWPHLYIYFNYFVYMALAKFRTIAMDIGLASTIKSYFPLLLNDTLIYYFVTRFISAFFGALTVIPVFLTAKNLFGKKAGYLSALAYAFIPFQVRHAHYALPDTPMVFFLAYAMYYGSRIIIEDKRQDYIKSGFFVGLSASTKYNGGLSAIVVPLAYLIRLLKEKALDGSRSFRIGFSVILDLILSGIFAVIGFVLGTPYSVLDYKTFSRTDGPQGAFWQFTNVGSDSFTLIEHLQNLYSDLLFKLSNDFGYTILFFFVVGIFFVLLRVFRGRAKKEDVYALYPLIPAWFFLWFISGFEKSRSHYYMIAYPFIAVSFGYTCALISDFLDKRLKNLGLVFMIMALTLPLYFSMLQSLEFYNGDTRNLFSKWVEDNTVVSTTILYDSSSMKDVVEVLPNRSQKIESKDFPKYMNAIFVTYGDATNNGYTLLEHISSDNYLGEDIYIYKLK